MTDSIDKYADTLDVRDIIERVEELEAMGKDIDDSEESELEMLGNLLDALKGNGGDKRWKGSRYPITLIRDSYFRDYAEELASDMGAIGKETMTWPCNCIDWNQAARELQIDYRTVEFDGVTYWCR